MEFTSCLRELSFTIDARERQGLGTLLLSNGEKFLGSFINGKVHGEGTFYKLNGEIEVGYWQNNQFVGKLH